ncbi:MAG: SRPBCC family protein, partial [Actinomycetota bacterium]
MAPQHVYQIFIKASPDRVWQAITDPAFTTEYFFHTAVESSFEPGSGHRYLLPDGETAASGNVEVVEPGHRLVLTWQALYDAELAEEPPSRVEWTLDPANDDGTVTRLRVRHYDLGLSPKTWAGVQEGWHAILDGMKTLLETGEPLGAVEIADPESSDEV